MLRALDFVFGGFAGIWCEFWAGVAQEFHPAHKAYKVWYDLGDGPQLDSCYYSWTRARRRLAEMRRAWNGEEAQLWLDLPGGGRQIV